MTVADFKDISAGIQSIAIVLATFLGGSWALFQFFSLRALEKAKLDLQKARRELVERGVLAIELICDALEIESSHFLHVRVVIRNIGNGVDIVDWSKARMFATRYEKIGETKLTAADEVLSAWRSPSLEIKLARFSPGFSSSDSFLIAIPKVGVYYIEFSVPTSPAASADTVSDLTKHGTKMHSEDVIEWRADTFVSVPQVRPNSASQPTR